MSLINKLEKKLRSSSGVVTLEDVLLEERERAVALVRNFDEAVALISQDETSAGDNSTASTVN